MSKIISIWERNNGVGLLFVFQDPYDAPVTNPSTITGLWVDVENNFVARVLPHDHNFSKRIDRPYPKSTKIKEMIR